MEYPILPFIVTIQYGAILLYKAEQSKVNPPLNKFIMIFGPIIFYHSYFSNNVYIISKVYWMTILSRVMDTWWTASTP